VLQFVDKRGLELKNFRTPFENYFKLILLKRILFRKHPSITTSFNNSILKQKRLKAKKGFYLKFKTKLIGAEGARLLREKRVQGRPRRRKGAEEAPGPPAESERLERKSTSKLFTYKKTVGRLDFLRIRLQSKTDIKNDVSFFFGKYQVFEEER
jgi:hypothetical protein